MLAGPSLPMFEGNERAGSFRDSAGRPQARPRGQLISACVGDGLEAITYYSPLLSVTFGMERPWKVDDRYEEVGKVSLQCDAVEEKIVCHIRLIK